MVFFFKQKTAYEIKECDWSSDVCSSDLAGLLLGLGKLRGMRAICLMAETHGGFIDPKSALALVNKLSEVLGIGIDTEKLEKKVADGEKYIKKMEEKAAKATGEQSVSGGVDTSYIR